MKRQKLRRRQLDRKRLGLVGGLLLALLVVVNIALWVAFRERTYPRTTVMGRSVGSVAYKDLAQNAAVAPLPQHLTLSHANQSVRLTPKELGVTKDSGRTVRAANAQRSWLPIINLFKTTVLQAPVHIDKSTFETKTLEAAKALRKDAHNAHLTLNGTQVGIADAEPGFELQRSALEAAILKALDKGKDRVMAPTTPTQPKLQASSLKAQKEQLEKQLATAVTYRYGNMSKRVPPTEIARWFVPAHDIYELDPVKAQAFITQVGKDFGIRVKDVASVTAQTTAAVAGAKALDITLVHQAALRVYTYCTAAKGVDAAHLPTFRSKLLSTLNDRRGWSLDGLVEFKEASSGCNFTAWLSAAELMPTFGGVCDPEWSCRSGANVVVNFNRWQNASPAWNVGGGALDEYRNMVINHETGHWLGFAHRHCAGPGQPAPVMQQQSINLEGCAFNAWPATDELATLRRQLGL